MDHMNRSSASGFWWAWPVESPGRRGRVSWGGAPAPLNGVSTGWLPAPSADPRPELMERVLSHSCPLPLRPGRDHSTQTDTPCIFPTPCALPLIQLPSNDLCAPSRSSQDSTDTPRLYKHLLSHFSAITSFRHPSLGKTC